MGELELLFFDTFSHENNEEINLDLVQFPMPVFIGEVRVIPLGARVQADFPGGVRLGATNPSQFKIEFFVNDLSKPSASTFENLGSIDYNQNGNIHLECDTNVRNIPTDGLVLRGWYTTITLAVYGTKNPEEPSAHEQQELATADWVQQHSQHHHPNLPQEDGRGYSSSGEGRYTAGYSQQSQSAQQPAGGVYQAAHRYTPRQHTFSWSQSSDCYDNSNDKDAWADVRQEDSATWESRNKERYSPISPKTMFERERSTVREESSPEYNTNKRGTPEYCRDYYSGSRQKQHQQQQQQAGGSGGQRGPWGWQGARKRPHTPPPAGPPPGPLSSTPQPPPTPPEHTSPVPFQATDESGLGMESMSPGDVESISEGDIPETETGISPTATEEVAPAGSGPEPFEPILSDEEIAEDMETSDMDYDFGEYSEDPLKTFNPYNNEIQPLKSLEDPALSQYEIERRKGKGRMDGWGPEGTSLVELVQSLGPLKESKEVWVETAEQLLLIFSKGILSIDEDQRQAVLDKLIEWTGFGLDFEEAMGQPQPGSKLRHLKAGIRLVEALAQCGEEVAQRLVEEVGAQERLLSLYSEEYMALSIKLMILRGLDVTLRYQSCVHTFISRHQDKGNSGYQRLVQMLEGKQHARIKYSLSSLVHKLHFYELLTKLNSYVKDIQSQKEDIESEAIAGTLDGILSVFIGAPTALIQPKRFLPVSAQFEINTSGSPDPYKAIYSYFRFFNVINDFISLLNHPSASCTSLILAPINSLLSELLETNDGLKFLLSTATINRLIRLLLGSPANTEQGEPGTSGVNPTLGLHTAYRLQTLSYLDTLHALPPGSDPDQPEVLDTLHGLFNLTLSNVGNIGKLAVVHVLSLGNNLDILLNLLKHKSALRKRSPSRGYICDLIVLTIKLSVNIGFFRDYVEEIKSLMNEFTELSEILVWIKPLESPSSFSYDNISPVVDFIKNNIDHCTNLPGDMITAVKLLRYLGIPRHDEDMSSIPVNCDFKELKYKCVILQLYSLDGITHLISILQKLCDYYEHPSLHSATLIGRQGLMLLAFVHPAVQLIRRMLTYVIRVRNTEFKDLSAIPILLSVYNLMQAIPINGQAHTDAIRVCREIIETLLAYTQPVSSETCNETDALNKSLWTSMISEVIKFCSTCPLNFTSGLTVFSELLPLPLPLQTRAPLSEEAGLRCVKARQLWSGHLHWLTPWIEELVGRAGVSSHQPLLQLLRRVCVQLADLAAPSALAVVRTLLHSISQSLDSKPPQLARLLNFLACLIPHGPVKAAFLTLIRPKEDKYYNMFKTLLEIFRTKPTDPASIHCQEYIASILQSLCDTEMSLVAPPPSVCSDVFLSNALPPRELLGHLVAAMLDHLSLQEQPLSTLLPVIRTLILLTENHYGLYHLNTCLERHGGGLGEVLTRLASEWSRESHVCLATVGSCLELYRPFHKSASLLAQLLAWPHPTHHPLLQIEASLKKSVQEDDSLEPLLENLTNLLKLLQQDQEKQTSELKGTEGLVEPTLPPPEPLLAQFALRQLYSVVDPEQDERLTVAYWLSPPSLTYHHSEPGPHSELVSVDLVEIAKQDTPGLSLEEEVAALCRAPGEVIPTVRGPAKKRNIETTSGRKPFVTGVRGGGRGGGSYRGGGGASSSNRGDMFRSRPPNTSRPPSLHVDDFVALETCGAQPTGPTGYNKLTMRAAQDLMASRAAMSRGVRGRTFGGMERGGGGRFFGSPTAYHRETVGTLLAYHGRR